MSHTGGAMSETLYLQDNFLSDADWDLPLAEKDSTFHGYYSLSEESDDKPSKTTNDLYQTGMSSSADNLIEELFESFLPHDSSPSQNTDEVYFPTQRRSSSNTSSSAYSSDSSSSPTSQGQMFDQFQSLSPDQFPVHLNNFDSKEQMDYMMELRVPNDVVQQKEICNEKHSKKSNLPFTRTRTVNGYRSNYRHVGKVDSETDLERAVRLACEETNRLLSMHKHSSEAKFQADPVNEPRPTADLLKDLCDKTILNNYNSSADNLSKVVRNGKQLKRKVSSSQRLKTSAKKSYVQCENSLPSSSTSACNSNGMSAALHVKSKVPSTETYAVVTPQTSQSNRNVAPDSTNSPMTFSISTNSLITNALATPQQPIQLCLKQEIPSPIILTNNTNRSSIPVNHAGITVVNPGQLFRQNGQTIVIQRPANNPPSSNCINMVDLTQTKDESFIVPQEKFVISQSDVQASPAKNLVRKPERNLLPLSDEAKLKLNNPVKDIKPALPNETHAKVVIASVADIKPNDIVSAIASKSAAVVMNGLNNQLKVDVKALKRHQRMIKNRASACQSRLRRKEYLKTLEAQVQECAEENLQLRKCNKELSSRVKELETENEKLHCLLMGTRTKQKKVVCALMLVLFIGINFFPFSGLDIGLPSSQFGTEQVFPRSNNVDIGKEFETTRSGRHLLSTVSDETSETQGPRGNSDSKSLMVWGENRNEPNKQSYWMDDLVQEYKNEHLKNFLKLLSETPSNSIKRMLRRKLKEELGIQIPTPIARNRRITYTLSKQKRPQKMSAEQPPVSEEPFRSKNKERTFVKSAATSEEYLPLKHSVKVPTSMTHPCEQTSLDAQQPNETETSRVSNDLKEWAKRYTTDRQIKAQKRDKDGKAIVQNKIISNRAPVSRYMEEEKSNAIALYNRPIDKYDDFFQAINRRNDTFYVISLNRDHLLLPAAFMNSSARMKMSLLMPAITKAHATEASFEDGYETMIQIECEVFNTRKFNLKRNVVPEFLLPKTHFYDDGKPVLVKNESEIWNQNNTNSMNQKPSRKKTLEQRSVDFPVEAGNMNVSLLHRIGKGESNHMELSTSLEEDAVVSDELDSDSYRNKGR